MSEFVDKITALHWKVMVENIKSGDYPTNDDLANCLRFDGAEIPKEVLEHAAGRLDGTIKPNLKKGRRKKNSELSSTLMKMRIDSKRRDLKEQGQKHSKAAAIRELADEIGMSDGKINKLAYPRKK